MPKRNNKKIYSLIMMLQCYSYRFQTEIFNLYRCLAHFSKCNIGNVTVCYGVTVCPHDLKSVTSVTRCNIANVTVSNLPNTLNLLELLANNGKV